ncbi:hypothetical protein FXB40_41355 [Bradyrhizobium rifense]|uniref:Uncharacterized protein n=1 Tax=Bradyrhizobium rifense TaxID=515499 RepID=A0A5D3K0Q6_9BRAD|nr:hypothetical protein [Bradyrhizobium rifense]TYL86648.1 hypothetical protein FXB40_41355 [Bradyrhizobium rifense]
MHPETKKGGDRRSKSQVGISKAEAFVADAAAKSGRSRTAVARAEALGADLDRVSRRRVPIVRKWKERPVAFGVVVRGDGFARSCSIGDGPLHLGGTRLGARGAPEIDLHEQLPPEARLICSVLKEFDPNLRIRKIQVRSQWSGRAAVPPALAEIDENLMRADLMAAERAKVLKARKKAYQDAHPETKRGGDRKSKAITATNCRTPFTADTAAKTGRSRKSVERDLRGLLPSPRCPARQRGFFGQPTGPF